MPQSDEAVPLYRSTTESSVNNAVHMARSAGAGLGFSGWGGRGKSRPFNAQTTIPCAGGRQLFVRPLLNWTHAP